MRPGSHVAVSPFERQALQAFAANLFKDYPVTVAKLAELRARFDLALLRAAVARYAKLPAADRHFVLRTSGENLIVTPTAAAAADERTKGQLPSKPSGRADLNLDIAAVWVSLRG